MLALSFGDRRPILAPASAPLLSVVREMVSKGRYHAVLVDEEGAPWGVMSVRDAAKAIFVVGEQGVEVAEAGSLGKILQNPCYLYASRPAITALRTVSLAEAVRAMVSAKIGCLPLVDESGKVVSVLDERFLIKAIPDYAAEGPCDVASWDPVSVEPSEEIIAAAGLMLSAGVRRVVLRGEEELRIASLSQVLEYVVRESVLSKLLRGDRTPLEEPVFVVSSKPWIVDCSYTLKEVASLVSADPAGAVLVSDPSRGRGPGIVTERDLLLALGRELERGSSPEEP